MTEISGNRIEGHSKWMVENDPVMDANGRSQTVENRHETLTKIHVPVKNCNAERSRTPRSNIV